MTPNELYQLEPQTTRKTLQGLVGAYYNHIPEAFPSLGDPDIYLVETMEIPERFEIRILKEFDFDHRRLWRLATVWFDDHPVMIIRNAGREGDDHRDRFVTDLPRYRAMIEYLRPYIPINYTENASTAVDPTVEIENLTSFYGNSLNGYFGRY